MGDRPYIAEIILPDMVRVKINNKHGITEDDVRTAALWPARPSARWHVDERGHRVILRGETSLGRRIQVVLYPVDPVAGTWRVGTAVPWV